MNALVSPAYNTAILGNDLLAILEALKTTTDSKTLASPKLLVVNGQESRIQVGDQLGFFVTTTTQTSTLQEVQFLDTGVVLTVTPIITEDNHVLMKVKPEISDGSINQFGLPEESTTEVDTTVLLADGYGMIIGGLIEEVNVETQTKVPYLGDIWLLGRVFQRREYTRERREIIIALIPRILPYHPDDQCREAEEWARVNTPLLTESLKPFDRRAFEAELPDAMRDPRRIKWKRIPHFFKNLRDTHPLPLEYYFPSVSEEYGGFPGFYTAGPFLTDGFEPPIESNSLPPAQPSDQGWRTTTDR